MRPLSIGCLRLSFFLMLLSPPSTSPPLREQERRHRLLDSRECTLSGRKPLVLLVDSLHRKIPNPRSDILEMWDTLLSLM